MYRYRIDLILETKEEAIGVLKENLKEIAEELKINGSLKEGFRLFLISPFPTQVFDICAQLGRLKSVKVEEI